MHPILILGPCPPTLRPLPSKMVGPVTVIVFKRWSAEGKTVFGVFCVLSFCSRMVDDALLSEMASHG